MLRRFCFSLHDYTEESYNSAVNLGKDKCKQFIIGKEICPATNRGHLQSFMYFYNLLRPNQIDVLESMALQLSM